MDLRDLFPDFVVSDPVGKSIKLYERCFSSECSSRRARELLRILMKEIDEKCDFLLKAEEYSFLDYVSGIHCLENRERYCYSDGSGRLVIPKWRDFIIEKYRGRIREGIKIVEDDIEGLERVNLKGIFRLTVYSDSVSGASGV
jgi:hypothetical protein